MKRDVVPLASTFDLQGHRGARGLLPENTLAGFERALGLGVSTLETDLAITSDGVVVLSHDAWLNPDITRDAHGDWLTTRGAAIRTLTLAELRGFDVGRINPNSAYAGEFPRQSPVDGARIPMLQELFALSRHLGRNPRYNIEIKTSPEHPDATLDPDDFARRVIEVVRSAGLEAATTIQSFDWRSLLAVKRLAPEIATICLTEDSPDASTVRGTGGTISPWLGGLDPDDHGRSLPRLVAAAGGSGWSPHWSNLDRASVAEAQLLGLRVVPWTVNTPDEITRVMAFGVNGLITDYPDLAHRILATWTGGGLDAPT